MKTQDIQLTHKKIYIFPTKNGFLFVILLIFMLLGSINYGNNLAYLLTFLLSGVSLVSIIHVYRNLYALQIKGGKCSPVFAGEQARFVISVHNPKPIDRFEIVFQPHDTQNQCVTSINRHETQSVTLPISTQSRGYFMLPKLKITSNYPLGLFFSWSWLTLSIRCLVYPKPDSGIQPLPHHTASGNKGSAVQAGSDDFLGFRRAQPADPPRHLNWKGFAKGQQLMAKQFGSQLDDQIWLNWEQTHKQEQEEKIALLTKWVLDAEERQVAYGLILPTRKIAPNLGPDHRHQCLKALALFRQG